MVVLYCKVTDSLLANPVRNQPYFMVDGHKFFPYGCSACGEYLSDHGDFDGDDDHIIIAPEEILGELKVKIRRAQEAIDVVFSSDDSSLEEVLEALEEIAEGLDAIEHDIRRL